MVFNSHSVAGPKLSTTKDNSDGDDVNGEADNDNENKCYQNNYNDNNDNAEGHRNTQHIQIIFLIHICLFVCLLSITEKR